MTRDLGRPPGEGGGLGLQRPPEEGQAGQQGGGHRGGGGGGGGHEDGRGHRYEEGGMEDAAFLGSAQFAFLAFFRLLRRSRTGKRSCQIAGKKDKN